LIEKPDINLDPNGLSRKGSLTPEMLKTFKGLENLSDNEAQEIVFSIQALTKILFDVAQGTKF